MKTLMTIACLIVLAQPVWGSDLIGGYVNSRTREAALAIQSGSQRIQVMNTAKKLQWGGAQYGAGKLFVVDSAGRASEQRGTFKDRTGFAIALPQGAYDKVVVLNRYGNIAWAAGLDDVEVLKLLPKDFQAQGSVIASAQKVPLFGALRYSSHVLRDMSATTDGIANMFLVSVRWMAGTDVEKLLRTVMERSGTNLLKGITPVAQGGDGSGGAGKGNPVAQGGDGSGGAGIIDPIAQGGDGSGGAGKGNPVAQGGDGSGGAGKVNLVAQGGDGSGGGGFVSDLAIQCGQQSWGAMPKVSGLSAVTMGSVVVVQ